MRPSAHLKEEHNTIKGCFRVVKCGMKKIKNEKLITHNFWSNILGFFEFYVDKSHHEKEEKYLLPVIRKKTNDKFATYKSG